MSFDIKVLITIILFTIIGSNGVFFSNENRTVRFYSDPLQNNDIQIWNTQQHPPHTLTQWCNAHYDLYLFEFEREWLFMVTAVLCVATVLFSHQSTYFAACALSICVLTSFMQPTHALVPNATEYILTQTLPLNQAIKVTADGFTGDPSDPITLYRITIYGYYQPSSYNELTKRFAIVFTFTPNNLKICGHDTVYNGCSFLKHDYDGTLFVSSDANDPIGLDFKLTSDEWRIYDFGVRIPEYDWPALAWDDHENVTNVVAEFMVNPVISIGKVTAAPPTPSNITGGFVATIIIFILASAAANAACIFLFYWKFKTKATEPSETQTDKTETKELKTKEAAGQTVIDAEAEELKKKAPKESTEPSERTDTTAVASADEPQEAEEPVWNHYLKIIVPFTFLLEDFTAIGLEDPDKTASVNIALVITWQFLSAMIISWCRECCTRSIPATVVPKVLSIMMEYLFAIILISFCRYVGLAGLIIGGLTIVQVVSEIMSIIFEQDTGMVFICPPCCKWLGRRESGRNLPFVMEVLHRKANGLPTDDLREDKKPKSRFTYTSSSTRSGTRTTEPAPEPKEETKGDWLKAMTGFMLIGVFFFLFGAIYVESGCFDDWFKYWWAFGMFMFDQLWDTPALEIWLKEARWRKGLLIAQFVALICFMFITTVSTTFSDDREKYEGCESGAQQTFEMASVYLYVACFLLAAAACMKCRGSL